VLYFSILVFIWGGVFLNIKMYSSLEIYDAIITISIGNFIAYLIVKGLNNSIFENEVAIICITIYTFFLFVFSVVSFVKYDIQQHIIKHTVEPSLMYKRKKDLERLIFYIDKYNIVGLNGRWGVGKSFLINEFKKEKRYEYEIIEIDVLTCDLNELLLILVKKMEQVLYDNGIISIYTNKLKSYLGNKSIISKLQDLIFKADLTYIETITGLQQELNRLDKKILIIYEDVDRIIDTDIIKKVFSISEKLSNNNIKVVYQYHEENLKNMKFTDDYLEKYIPFKMNVTEINFFEVLRFTLYENKYDENILKIRDFDFLQHFAQPGRYTDLAKKLNINEINLIIKNFCTRKVENFSSELYRTLKYDQYEHDKETVIAFYFIKHFFPTIFEKLSTEERLSETIKFKDGNDFYTMPDLLALKNLNENNTEKIQRIFLNEENQLNYCVLKLFNYRISNNTNEESVENRKTLIFEEPERELRDRVNNQKKDNVIWHLLASGKSKNTDYEFGGYKFVQDVLNKPEKDQLEAFRKFDYDMFHQNNLELDNQSIFKLGVPPFIELFKSFQIIDAESKDIKKLVNLYFSVEKIEKIDVELIQTLNFCPIKTVDLYVNVLNKFNELEIIGNLNTHKCFADFMNKFLIKSLPQFGILDTNRYFCIDGGDNIVDIEDEVMRELKDIVKKIEVLRKKLNSYFELDLLDANLNIITKFIEKLIGIIEFKGAINTTHKSNVKMDFCKVNSNETNKEFNRLVEMDSENFNKKEEIIKSYNAGKITINGIAELIDKSE